MTTPATTNPTKVVSTTGATPGTGTLRCATCDRTRPPEPTPVVGGTACTGCGVLR